MTTIDPTFLEDLEAAVMDRKGKPRNGKEISFTCPAHDDEHPSASYNTEKAVWHCHTCGAGGGAYHLAGSLGVELPQRETAGVRLAELAEYVGLPLGFLRAIGLDEGIAGFSRHHCVDIPYLNEDGEVKAVHKRVRITGEPRFLWRSGDKVLPYGLPRLREARKAGSLLIVEGDSDSWTAWFVGLPALGVPGASTLATALAKVGDIEKVYVWREPDQGGDAMAELLITSMPNAYIITPPEGVKDLNALWHNSGHDVEVCRARLDALMTAATPASLLRASGQAPGRDAAHRWNQLAPKVTPAIRRRPR